jgi:AcrR family transcriptional regulator
LERIVATALQIVDEEGADALSMRTLAQRLGSGTATLYRHFDNRAALVAHVVDRMFGVLELNGDELLAMGWERALRTVAHTMSDALARHPNAARLLVEQIPLGPNAMALREHSVAVSLGSGFPPRVAAYAYATLARNVLGFAYRPTGTVTQDSPTTHRRRPPAPQSADAAARPLPSTGGGPRSGRATPARAGRTGHRPGSGPGPEPCIAAKVRGAVARGPASSLG